MMQTMDTLVESVMERKTTYTCVCGRGFIDNEFAIQCDHCKEWFHGLCVSLYEFESEEIDRFYCTACHSLDNSLVLVPKAVTNNWRHNPTEPNPTEKAIQSGTQLFISNLKNKKFTDAKTDPSVVRRMRGQQLTLKELLLNGFKVPILIETKDGLELTVPTKEEFGYRNLLDHYKADYMLDVIDVKRQMNIKMRVQDFVDKHSVEYERRSHVYNCISLEVSNNSLSGSVRAPNIVHKLSWVDNYWPAVESRPTVSKYCLISMKDSFTDFHIDFGGTSVWYHVLSGEKVFFIIKPTKQNLEQYEKWMSSPTSTDRFLPDIVGHDQCYRLTVSAGHTLLIPTGWIHAVLTPEDSLVFGGNFLHSLNIELQLKVREMEQRIKTPFKFQFPFFEMTHWYAAPNVLKLLQDSHKPPHHVVNGVKALVPQLKLWLKKSKDFQNQNELQISSLSPKGFECLKLIKDLNQVLNKAIRKTEGPPPGKKRGKSYKDFNLEPNDNLMMSSPQLTDTSSPEKRSPNKKPKTKDNESQDLEASERSLVVDDSVRAVNKVRKQSTDSESKGSLKLKLSISGAKEILGTNRIDPNLNEDLYDFKVDLDSNDKSDPQKQLTNKRKRKKPVNYEMDEEIESMVKGRPEDDNYIYLDIETPNDEEMPKRTKSTARDESWAPKARLTIRGTPKEPRLPRDEAKRAVVESSLANAAAKMENMPQQKRQYVRKRTKTPKMSAIESSIDSMPASVTSGQDSQDSPSGDGSVGSSKTINNQLTRKGAKKGQKTAKQRLHKIICQKKKTHF